MVETEVISRQTCDHILKNYTKSEEFCTDKVKITDHLPDGGFRFKVCFTKNSKCSSGLFLANKTNTFSRLLTQLSQTIPKFEAEFLPRICFDDDNFTYLEDPSSLGFATETDLQVNHFEFIIEKIAKLHAASLAYEELKSLQLKRVYRLDEDFQVRNLPQDASCLEYLQIPGTDPQDLEKFLHNLKKRVEEAPFRRVLCHGSLIPSNIMFKYEYGLISGCKFVNFADNLYSDAVYDVVKLIVWNSSEDFRQKYFHQLLDLYYKSLGNELAKFKLNLQEIIPAKDLELSIFSTLPLVKLEKYQVFGQKDDLVELLEVISKPRILREDCYQIVKNFYEDITNHRIKSFQMKPLTEAGGYLGDYFKLNLIITNKLKNSEEQLKFFVKTAPQNDSSKSLCDDCGSVSKEIFFYKTLVPELNTAGVKTINDCVPACFFLRTDDLLVLEDLTLLNYKSSSPEVTVSIQEMGMILKTIARFHASFVAYEELENVNLNEKYADFLAESVFVRDVNHSGFKLSNTGLLSIPYILDLFPELKTDENQRNFAEKWELLRELYYDLVKPSPKYRNVLNHGDLWVNNIFSRQENGQVLDCRILDFQILRYGQQSHDFAMLLYFNTDRDFRKKYQKKCLEIYHEEFSRILAVHGLSAQKILSFQDFQQSFETVKTQAILLHFQYTPFMLSSIKDNFLADPETCRKALFEDRTEFLDWSLKHSKNAEGCRNKLRDCCLDLYDVCAELSRSRK